MPVKVTGTEALAVGDGEADLAVGALRDAAVDDHAAEADAGAGRQLAFGHIGRRVEEDDLVGERVEDQSGGDRQHDPGKRRSASAAAACASFAERRRGATMVIPALPQPWPPH